MGVDHDSYYRIALASMLTSVVTVMVLALAIPTLYLKADREVSAIDNKAMQFKVRFIQQTPDS